MIGRRLPDGDFPERAGDYAKHVIDGQVAWLIRPPGCKAVCAVCVIGKPNSDGSHYHWVRENEDGTITVEPHPADAPPARRNSNSIQFAGWHGYIYAGEWRRVSS